MSNPSNLYAEKVFGEHPLALWPLDETVDYISFVDFVDRDFSGWDLTDCTVTEDYFFDREIVSESVYEVNSVSVDTFELSLSDPITGYLNPELNSVGVGFYFYPQTTNIESIEYGYKYDSNGTPRHTNDAERYSTFTVNAYGKWHYVSDTFDLPTEEKIALDPDENYDIVPGTPTKILLDAHGFSDGDRFKLDFDYDIPAGLNAYNVYYVVNAEDDSFELEETLGAGSIQFSYPTYGNMNLVSIKTITPFVRYNLLDYSTSKSYLHSLNIGQVAEEYLDKSQGISLETLPNININSTYSVIEASSYGLNDVPAYYLARENKLLAKNTNMPIVYGSSTITSLLPERFGGPSMIIPGQGFLNESGRYKTYTAEFWLRISPDTVEPKRIFGPIASTDGLYVDGPFLTLKIGDSIGSHYVGEWYRPMLVNILVFRNGASMVINGETVLDLTFLSSDLVLPDSTNLAGKEQNWLGFYSYSDIDQFEIDCIGIYSYRVPAVVSKRRWVYGQAVDFPENLSASYSGKSFPIDYTFAKYSNNYIYPDIARWRQGISENISSNNNVLQPPSYSLPEIIFNNKTSDSWTRSLTRNNTDSINLKPDDSWVDTDGYIFFDKADVLEQKTAGFYMAVDAPFGFNSTETLFRLQNQITGNYLEVDLHTINQNILSISGTTITSASHGLLDNDIISFSGSLPSELESGKEYFVYKIDDNSFYVAESKNGTAISISSITENSVQFIAQVMRYRLSFNSVESLVYQTPAITLGTTFVAGLNFSAFAEYFGGNVATLIGNKRQLRLYIAGSKDFTKTFSGSIYRIGFCTQRNLNKLSYLFDENGVPFLRYQFDGDGVVYASGEPSEEVDAGYVYEDYINDILSHVASYTLALRSFFGSRYLDIAVSSYWQDYVPLTYFAKNRTTVSGSTDYGIDFIQYNSDTTVPLRVLDGNIDTSGSLIKTYVSFQLVESGPTQSEDSFTTTKLLPRNRIVDPGSDWMTTKYEVVNGTLIYPPPGVDINDVAIVTHIDMSTDGIIKNPVRVRSVQLAGKSLNALMSNPIQTKLGVSIYPYKKYGIYYDYKAENPYLIYKDSTPHLYLTKHSGLEITGDFPDSNRGFSLPVNKEKRSEYDLSMIQMSMKFTRDDIVTDDMEIMHIENGTNIYREKIWLRPTADAGRFRLYSTDIIDNETDNILFYINGQLCKNPTISLNEWNVIGIAFIEPVDIDGKSGRINFVGPIMFNNVSYYALNAAQNAAFYRSGSSEYLGVNPELTYQIFTGTNKLVFGDDLVMFPEIYQYSVINDLNVQSATITPV